MSLRFHEIAEAEHDILNPIGMDKLDALAAICEVDADKRVLDIASGKGAMLRRWAAKRSMRGVGVDISGEFCGAARDRAREENIDDLVGFVEGEAAQYLERCQEVFDVVSCLGATWIGGGLRGTLDLMVPRLRGPDSHLVVGEVFWSEPPPEEALRELTGDDRELFATLEGTLDRFESRGLELVHMIAAGRHEWDEYYASQWLTVDRYLRTHPEETEAEALRSWIAKGRRQYLRWERRYFEWAIFVTRPRVVEDP